ncbi:hypothetical protein [Nitrosospira sp. Nsp1]|uniref:hypothetical protein n=1 Tax=Nitrosospira sp. Nsp1 TaxID=136547 RepID=UPI00115F89AE|nr:hypothetical protein [Nitrosospira sp. Nsp1]
MRWRTEALCRKRSIQSSSSAWPKAGLPQDEIRDGARGVLASIAVEFDRVRDARRANRPTVLETCTTTAVAPRYF